MDGKTGAGGATEGGEAPDTITVKVLAMNQPGAPLVLRCRLDDRVAQLHRLAAAQHTPPLGPHEYLKLLYCGRMLRDARTLREEALEDGCTVHAILSQHPPSNATSGGSSTRSTRNNNSRSNNNRSSSGNARNNGGQRRGLDALADMGFSADDAAQMWALYRMETGVDTSDPDAPRDYAREEQWLRGAAGVRPVFAGGVAGEADRTLQQLALLFAMLQEDEDELARIAAVPELRGDGRRGATGAAAAMRQQAQAHTVALSFSGGAVLEVAGGFAIGAVLGVLALLLLCEVPLNRRVQVGVLVGITCNIIFTFSVAARATPHTDDEPQP